MRIIYIEKLGFQSFIIGEYPTFITLCLCKRIMMFYLTFVTFEQEPMMQYCLLLNSLFVRNSDIMCIIMVYNKELKKKKGRQTNGKGVYFVNLTCNFWVPPSRAP